MAELEGQVGLVTGASRGLGRAIALELADAGAHVALCARSIEGLKDTEDAIAGSLGSASSHRVDVTDEQAVERTVAEVVERHGRLDFLVNNAGTIFQRPFVDVSFEQWRSLFATNVDGPFLLTRSVVNHMDPDRGGAVLNVASVFATSGVPGFSAYAASKAAVLGLTTTLAVELASAHVRVNALLPGYFATDMTQGALADDGVRARIVRAIPAGRVGQPDELGATVRFLLSDAAAYVTGATLTLDGGFSSR